MEELNRILDERVLPNQNRAALANIIQNNYEHDHDWKYRRVIKGSTQCEQCGWEMDFFGMFCGTCQEARCRRCTFNR